MSSRMNLRPYRPRITSRTYIRDLPYYVLQNIARHLDPDGTSTTWRDLALRIPQDSMNPSPKYTMTDIQHFEMCARQGRSATLTLLASWGTTNVTAQDLVNLFYQMNLPKLAEMIIPHEGDSISFLQPHHPMDQPPLYAGTIAPVPVSQTTPEEKAFLNSATTNYSSIISVRGRKPIEHDSVAKRHPTENCTTETSISDQLSLDDLTLDRNLPSFSYSDLSELTSNFNESCKLGEGAFGSVFSGHLNQQKKPSNSNSRKIAIKRLKLDVPDLAVAVAEQFKKEIHIISELEHENILPLVGYSCDGPELCLVYDFMFNGSLSSNLHACREGTNILTVTQRMQIAEGSAAGIEYLHGKKLVHRDIKSSNILLDMDTKPRISDFGLIRSVFSTRDKTSTVTTKPIGTPMYMAPEAYRGEVSSAMDVFGFGIVLLELITSRAVHDEDRDPPSLESYITELCDDDPSAIMDLVDKEAGVWNRRTAIKFYELATACLHYKRKKRPTMTKFLQEIRKLKLP